MRFSNFWKSNKTLLEVVEKWGNYVMTWNFFEEQDSIMET